MYIDCSFTRKKSKINNINKKKCLQKKINTINNDNSDDIKNNKTLIVSNQKSDYELSVISNGRTVLIKGDSYKSNLL